MTFTIFRAFFLSLEDFDLGAIMFNWQLVTLTLLMLVTFDKRFGI